MHVGGGIDAGRGPGLGMEDPRRPRVGEVRVGETRLGSGRLQVRGQDHGGGAGRGQARHVARVGHEREVPGSRVFDSADPVHLDASVTAEDAAEAIGQLAEDHPVANPPSCWPAARNGRPPR